MEIWSISVGKLILFTIYLQNDCSLFLYALHVTLVLNSYAVVKVVDSSV